MAAQHRNSYSPALHWQPETASLELSVIFTNVRNTLQALDSAARMSAGLTSRINVLAPESSNSFGRSRPPAVLADLTARYFLSTMSHDPGLTIAILSYPDSSLDLWDVLPPNSMIVLAGAKRRVWPSTEQRFARHLRAAGHEVFFIPARPLPLLGKS